MIQLEKVVGNTSLTQFDVLIIGSGPGGSAAAAVLTAAGQKVLILEAGPNYFQNLSNPDSTKLSTYYSNDELKMIQRSIVMPDTNVDPRTFRHDDSQPRTYVGDVNLLPKSVGGAFNYSDMKAPRFLPTDFQLGTLLKGQFPGTNFADWPVTYDQLEPFYDYVERAIGVQGIAGANPYEGWRSRPFPMAPGVPMYLALLAAQGATSLGYHPFPYPTAINSRPYGGRSSCTDCGFCGDYGCTISAKGGAAVTLLRNALLTGNCLLLCETRATKLQYSSGQSEITGVEALDPTGKPVVYTADRYILAMNAVEDARMLLLSDPSGTGIGNSSGMVGRNVTFHCQNLVLGIFENRLHSNRGRTVTHGMADFRGTPGDPNHPLGGIIEFGNAGEPIREALNYVQELPLNGGYSESLMAQSPLRDRLLVLTMQAEDAPQLSNRVDLDPDYKDLDGLPAARVTYQRNDFELKARDFYVPKMLDVMGAAGAKYGIVAPIDDVPVSRHVMGTLRFGPDPTTSVCDPTGRFHDVGNLYASDGSLFPTSTGYNPTLSIMTLSTLVAATMVSPTSPEQAIPTLPY